MFDFFLRLVIGFWATLGEMSPYLLFGFFVAGLLSVVVSQKMVARHLGGAGFWPVLKASLFGIPLPLCSCGVIPVSMSLHERGASRASTVSFLLSTPQTGVDSILVTYSLLGPVFAIFRPLAALATGLIGGTLVNLFGPGPQDGPQKTEDGQSALADGGQATAGSGPRARPDASGQPQAVVSVLPNGGQAAVGAGSHARPDASGQPQGVAPTVLQSGSAVLVGNDATRHPQLEVPPPAPSTGSCCCHHSESRLRKLLNGLKYGFISLPRNIGKPLLLGLVVAALISAVVPDDFFAARLGHGLPALLLMMLIGIPIYVCASASVPVAAALILKGLSPGAALVFLMTGPATNAAGLITIWKTLGRRTATIYLATVAGCALAGGLLLDLIFRGINIEVASHMHSLGPSIVQHISAVVLLAVLGYAFLTGRRH